MKKLILLLLFVSVALIGSAQKNPFFQPVRSDLFEQGSLKTLENANIWLFRPVASITAVQLNWNKLSKQFDASALSSAGVGVGYQHYVELPDGSPYNNYGGNLLLLLGADINQVEPATISLALTGSFLNFINVGGLYNFTNNNFGILTSVSVKF